MVGASVRYDGRAAVLPRSKDFDQLLASHKHNRSSGNPLLPSLNYLRQPLVCSMNCGAEVHGFILLTPMYIKSYAVCSLVLAIVAVLCVRLCVVCLEVDRPLLQGV